MRAIVSLSGGLDSAVLMAHTIHYNQNPTAVIFSYGSKHNEYENKKAIELCQYYEVNFQRLDISPIFTSFKSDLLMNGGPIPEGHYEEESMNATVVPARNIIFVSILAGLAESAGAETVCLGIHAGDHAIYPDCRPGFFYAMHRALGLGTKSHVKLYAPFLYQSKGGIVRKGLEMKVPFELTRTCYKDQELACGKCGSCTERLKAFAENGAEDPIKYA